MKQFRILFLLALSALLTPALAQNVALEKLNNKLSVLNDRAFLNFPDSTQNVSRPVDIMSADHNVNEETRFVVDFGTHRLVFFAVELFSISEKGFVESVSNQVIPGYEFNHKLLVENGSLMGVLSTPLNFDSTSKSIPVNRFTVKTQDNTLFRIDAFINPEAYSIRDEYVQLTEKVFKTISSGTRFPQLKAHKETLPVYESEYNLEFKLPNNWMVTIDKKYDFEVFQLHKYSPFGSQVAERITIYFGHHPSPIARQMGFGQSPATVMDKFVEKQVEWAYYENQIENIFLQEKIIEVDEISKGLLAHVAVYGTTSEAVESMMKIVRTIRLVK